MGFRQKIEDNVVIFLLSTLVTGFLSGIAAYEAILRISDVTKISKSDKERLENEVKALRAREGKQPREVVFTLAAGLNAGEPTKPLDAAKLDDDVVLHTSWFGLTPNGLYEQRWEVRDPNGNPIGENAVNFVAGTSQYSTWWFYRFAASRLSEGTYHLRVSLNGQDKFDKPIKVIP